MDLDIKEGRKKLNYSKWIYMKRLLWSIGNFFFRCSPRIAFGYRNFILRLFGAKIGKGVHIYSSATIWFPWNLKINDYSAIGEKALIYNLGYINIGRQVTISQRAHLCAGTHDYTDPQMPLIRPEINVENNVWICADAFIGPGIIIKEGCIIGARAVITKNSEPWKIYAGNPAKIVKERVLKSM